jgi:molybdopterin synthase catalytic subunit
MDWLKTDAPFWRREIGPEGESRVAAKAEDDVARGKWKT